ncbi:MAG TPA: hypothetical protein VKF32_07890, partial [Thermoanaerobaculia bacterium]|nr:hypothetical protein [Thermoanaerobaculia bacterium]
MRSTRKALAALAAASLLGLSATAQKRNAGYDDLVLLFHDWRAFQRPAVDDGVPDYTAAAMEKQRRALPEWQRRLAAIDAAGWPVARRVDWELVRAEMNGLDFDHRVLKPWSRNPCFYAAILPEESDTPAKEGPAFAGAIPVFRYTFPLAAADVAPFRVQIRAIPRILEQAKRNLTGDARDLWLLGIRVQKEQARLLADLEKRLAPHHADLVADAGRARDAVDSFRAWLEAQAPSKKGPSGVGVADYDWYVRHVHLLPYGWHDEAALMRRELARSTAALALERNRNRALPELEPAATAEELARRFDSSVAEYMRFLREKEILTITDDLEPALRAQKSQFSPPEKLDFFGQVDARDPLTMICHKNHWFDLARMKNAPHKSPIRKGPLLYNIWDGRAEGMATAMEEMMMTDGLFDARPRSRELIDILVANRGARGLAGLLQQSHELTTEQAVKLAHDLTPNGWLRADGDLAWGEQQNYLEQPGYGTSYLTGKAQIE